jgi:hypothetical protein
MKTTVLALLWCATILAAAPAPPQNVFSPDQIRFGPAPPVLPCGAQLAVLEGDPTGSLGDFTICLKMPDGYRIAPHWDASKMDAFPAGSFAYMEPSMHHYGMAAGETVVQVHGVAPFQINCVNPGDDPGVKKQSGVRPPGRPVLEQRRKFVFYTLRKAEAEVWRPKSEVCPYEQAACTSD